MEREPPRGVGPLERVLARLVAPSPYRDAILGDLREGFARRAARSPQAARRWYRRQAASLAWHYLPALPAHTWRAARRRSGDPTVSS